MFALYPLRAGGLADGRAARRLLGLALGAVQPMIMTTLHQITPPDRHGEAIALRSMTINLSSALMPLLFGALGAALGAVDAVLADGRGGGRRQRAGPAHRRSRRRRSEPDCPSAGGAGSAGGSRRRAVPGARRGLAALGQRRAATAKA